VLKEYLCLDNRGFAEHLTDHPDLARLIDLKIVHHSTTFQKAAARLLRAAPPRALFVAVPDRALGDKVRLDLDHGLNTLSHWMARSSYKWQIYELPDMSHFSCFLELTALLHIHSR
jgi:hypothetical protein